MGDVTLEIGNGQLTARWEAVGGADSYEVFFSQSAARPENAADTVNALYKTITGLTNGNTYYIWVRPRNQRGAGGISGAVSGKPMGNPGTLTVMPEDGKLIVSWNAVPGADSYDIYYGTTETPPAAPVFTGRTGNSAEITGLLNGTIYYVWFKAKQTSGAVSELSERVRGKPRVVVPAGLYDNGTAQTNKIGNQNLEAAYTYLNSYAVSGHTYYIVLGADEETYSLNFNYPGKTVGIHIQGNGLETTVTLGANTTLFTINEGVTMTLSDIILQGRTTNASYRLINVTGGALVIESDAKITGNGGGGISVSGGGTLTMNGGEISGHVKTGSSSNTGGGVYVTAGSFAMHGGEIKGNTGWSYGGGVGFISSGGNVSFVMDGGTISGNSTSFSSSSYGGGGVYVRRYSSSYTASFTMSGGAISDNSAQCGGGVYVDQYSSSYTASFTMSGGTISGNTASYYQGGGVYSSGTFIMNNGTISGNTASYDSGGGVYSSGTFTMSGGTISGNTASSSYGAGGGVYVGGGTFTKSGTGTAVIYGSNASDTLKNTASSNNGHAVYVNSGSKKRNTTARAMDALDSSVAGAAGGWE
jgi:hypothetical protein